MHGESFAAPTPGQGEPRCILRSHRFAIPGYDSRVPSSPLVIAREMRREYGIPEPANSAAEDDEVELIWAMHSSVFYIGVRKWIYDMPTPKDLQRVIDLRVDAFVQGAPAVLKAQRKA